MSTTYLIRNASILGGEPTDLLLEDGVIAEVGSGLAADGAEVVDATGLIALPGLVDLHTHLREPGREDAPAWSSRSGGWAARPATATSTPWAP
jgi:dihydroorotase